MTQKRNYIIFFILWIVINFSFGCSSKIKNVNKPENSSKASAIDSKQSESNKNVPQQKNTEKNELVQNNIPSNDTNQNSTDSKKQSIDENELKSEVERIYNMRSNV